MENYWSDAENIVQTGRIKVPYTWQAGETASYYFTQLRDAKKLFWEKMSKMRQSAYAAQKSLPVLHGTNN